jgi:hypothetical protein
MRGVAVPFLYWQREFGVGRPYETPQASSKARPRQRYRLKLILTSKQPFSRLFRLVDERLLFKDRTGTFKAALDALGACIIRRLLRMVPRQEPNSNAVVFERP